MYVQKNDCKGLQIENRFQKQIKELDLIESAVFVIINNHCDKGNKQAEAEVVPSSSLS